MFNRGRAIKNIIADIKAGMAKAGEVGEGVRPETMNFKTGPYAYSMFQGGPTKPNLTPEEMEAVIGYRGAFKSREPLMDSSGNRMLDQQGNQLFTSGNREYDSQGNVIGYESKVDPLTGEATESIPSGGAYGVGYTLGRAGLDWGNNATLGTYWQWNHPLGGASSLTRNIMGNSGVGQGNRWATPLSAVAPAVLMGAAAGNVALDNITSGEAGRAPGTQAVLKKRREDGTFDPDRQTESNNAIAEVALRYLGRSGYLINEYDAYFDDMIEHGKLPVDKETYSDFKAQQFERKDLSNAFGLFKASPTNPVSGEASFQQLGYHVPLSSAAALGGGLTAMGGMSRIIKDNPQVLGAPGTKMRNRKGAALMGAAMAVGGGVGNIVGQGANDLVQRVVNPRNHAFQQQVAEELQKRQKFINDNS